MYGDIVLNGNMHTSFLCARLAFSRALKGLAFLACPNLLDLGQRAMDAFHAVHRFRFNNAGRIFVGGNEMNHLAGTPRLLICSVGDIKLCAEG